MKRKNILPDIEKARKDVYYATVVLSESRKEHFQFVFASQVYGTFFGIYSKFEVEKQASGVLVKKIVFRLINYKGIINLGITNIELKKERRGSKKYVFNIKLKGLMPLFQDFPFVPPGNVPLLLDSSDEFIVKRELESFSYDEEDVITDGVFDDEFYFKDGLFPIKSPKSELEAKIEKRFPIQGLGPRCPKTLVQVVCG